MSTPPPSYEKIFALYGELGTKPSGTDAKKWGELIANDPNFAQAEYKALSVAAKRSGVQLPDFTTFQSKFDPLKKKESAKPVTGSEDGLQPPQGSGEQPLQPTQPINLLENLPLVPQGTPKPTTELDIQTDNKSNEIRERMNDWTYVPETLDAKKPTPPTKPEKKGMELVEGVLGKTEKKGLELVESVLDTKPKKPIERVAETIGYTPEGQKYKEELKTYEGELKAYEEEVAKFEEKYPVLTFPKKEIESVQRNREKARQMDMTVKDLFNATSQYMEQEFLTPEFEKEKQLVDQLYNAEKSYLDLVKNPEAYGATDPSKKAEQIAILRDNVNNRKEELARYRKATTIFADNRITELQAQLVADPDNQEIRSEIARMKALKQQFISEESVAGIINDRSFTGGKITSIDQFRELYMGWYTERNELLEELGLKGKWNKTVYDDFKRGFATNVGWGYDEKKVERLMELEDKLRVGAPAALVNRNPSSVMQMGAGERFAGGLVDALSPARVSKKLTPEIISNETLNLIANYSLPVGEENVVASQERTEGPSPLSGKGFAGMLGTTVGIMVPFAVGAAATRVVSAAITLVPTLARFATAFEVFATSNKFGRIVYPAIKSGAEYEAVGQIFKANPLVSDEGNFAAGFLGNLGAQAVLGVPAQKAISAAYVGLFGKNAAKAFEATTKFGRALRASGELIGTGLGESAEEYGNEMGSIYRDSDTWAEAKGLIEQRFGTLSQNVEFIVSTALLGAGMGAGSIIGKYAAQDFTKAMEAASPEERAQVNEILNDIMDDPAINEIREEVENEVKAQEDAKEEVVAEEDAVTETPTEEVVTEEAVEKTPEQEADEIVADVLKSTGKEPKKPDGPDDPNAPTPPVGGDVKPPVAEEPVQSEVEATTKALERLDRGLDQLSDYDFSEYKFLEDISEAYHKAKADGSNPELVEAVEGLLQENKPTISKEQPKTESEIPTWVAEFERTKNENDLVKMEELYNKIKVVQNGVLQGRIKDPIVLEKTAKELNDLKKQIEDYAENRRKENQPKVSAVTETDTKKQPINKIEDLQDVGEKIGGAKKDLAQKLSKEQTEPTKEEPKTATPSIPKTPEKAVPDAESVNAEAEEARVKGQKTIDGVKYTRREPLKEGEEVILGKQGKSTFKPGEATGVPFTYGLVDMNRIETTQKGVTPNQSNFIPESQPKPISETRDLENKKRAENFENEQVGVSATNPFQGFVNVNSRGEVFQGTGRWNILNYNKDKAGRIEYLKSIADQTGITPEQIDAFMAANPDANIDIVKVYDVTDSQAIRLGNYGVQESETTPKGTAIKQLVAKITPETVSKIQGVLGDAVRGAKYGREAFREKGKDVLDAMQKSGVLTETEYANLFNSEGEISTEGIDFVENVMANLVFPSNATTIDKLPDAAKKGLLKSIPTLLATPIASRINDTVDRAVKAAYQATKAKMTDIAQWSNQKDGATGKIPKDIYTPLELAIANVLLNKTENQIAATFLNYLDAVLGSSNLFNNVEGLNRNDATKQVFGVEWTNPESMRTDDKVSLGGTDADIEDGAKEKSRRLSKLKKKDDIRGGEFRETRPTAADNKDNQQEIDNAYESTQKYTEAVTTASDNARSFGESLKKKFDKLRGRLSGPARKRRILSPAQKIQKEGFVNVIGTVVEGVQDLAELFSITRNPNIEQGTVVYLKEGKVVSFAIYSSGLIDRTAAPASYRAAEAKAVGADSYYLIHNHPSGNPKPSNEDVDYTKSEAVRSKELGMTFKGSLVLNGGTFYQIAPSGEATSRPYGARPLHEQGTVLRNTAETAEFARQIIEDTQSPMAIVFFDTQGGIIDWHPVPIFNTAAEMTAHIKGLYKLHGGAVNVIIGQREIVDSVLQGGVRIPFDTDLLIDPVTGETRAASRVNKERDYRKSKSGSRVRELLFMDAAGNTSEDVIDNILNDNGGTFKAVINGQNQLVRKVDVEVVNGFYSTLEKTISDAKQDKIPAKQWMDKFATSDEAKWTGLRDWLSKQQGSLTKQQVLDYLRENRIEIVEVVKSGEIVKKDEAKLAEIESQLNSMGFTLGTDMGGGGAMLIDSEGEIADYNENQDAYRLLETYNELSDDNFNVNSRVGQPDTKYSQYQLDGEKENYKEVLVTMPNKELAKKPKWNEKQVSLNLSSRGDYSKTQKRWTASIDGDEATITELPQKGKYVLDFRGVINAQFDSFNEAEKYITDKQSQDRVKGKSDFKSSHFDEANILVHLRMNTRTDADGNKVLFLEEIQSDWGQKGKKEGFATPESSNRIKEINGRLVDIANDISAGKVKKGDVVEEQSELIKERDRLQKSERYPTAPFVTDTNAWTKLGLKVALKEAVKQGADKIAWSTGTQQFDRWGSEKISWKKEGNKWKIDLKEQESGNAFDGINIDEKALAESNVSVSSKEQLKEVLNRNLRRERNEAEIDKLTERIWNRMQTEDSGTSLPRKEGMEGFYGVPSENKLGIVGNVAKSLFKQEPKVTTLNIGGWKNTGGYLIGEANYVGGFGVYDPKGDMVAEFDTKAEANKFIASKSNQTQHSIDITPELKAQVEEGLPLMQQRTSLDNEVVEEMRGIVIDTIRAAQSISLKSIIKELMAEGLEHYIPELIQAYKDVRTSANLTVEVFNSMDDFAKIASYDIDTIRQEYEQQKERQQRELAAEFRRAAALSELGVQSEPIYSGGVSRDGGGVSGRPDLRYAASTRLGDYGSNAVKEIVAEGQYNSIDEHQRYAINMMLTRFKSGQEAFLLADGTGVGKSLEQLVAAIEMAKMTGRPSLIITQNQAIINDNFINQGQKKLLQLFGGAYGVEYATYSDLSSGKISAEKEYGALFLDESHNVKNPLSKRGASVRDIKRGFTVFATATPMDKPEHLEYFMPQLTGMTVQDLRDYLGYTIEITEDFATKQPRIEAIIDNLVEYTDKLIELRNNIIEQGGMIRREYPFYGTIQNAIVPISNMEEITDAENKLEEETKSKIYGLQKAASRNKWTQKQLNDKIRQQYEMRSNEAARLTESVKFPFVASEVERELAAGRKVVVVVDAVQDEVTLKRLGIKTESLTSRLAKRLSESGIKHGFILGSDKKAKEEAAKQFQEGNLDVIIMTSKSGGTGIDLDDQVGDKPRTLIYVTPDYSASQIQQTINRVSRRNTASPAKAIFVYANTESDSRRRKNVDQKVAVLQGIQNGTVGESIDAKEQRARERKETVKKSMMPSIEMSEDGKYSVSNAYPIKDILKSLGAYYHGSTKTWRFKPELLTAVEEAIENFVADSDVTQTDEQKYQASKKELFDSLNSGELGVGMNPQKMFLLIKTAYYGIKSGYKSFRDWFMDLERGQIGSDLLEAARKAWVAVRDANKTPRNKKAFRTTYGPLSANHKAIFNSVISKFTAQSNDIADLIGLLDTMTIGVRSGANTNPNAIAVTPAIEAYATLLRAQASSLTDAEVIRKSNVDSIESRIGEKMLEGAVNRKIKSNRRFWDNIKNWRQHTHAPYAGLTRFFEKPIRNEYNMPPDSLLLEREAEMLKGYRGQAMLNAERIRYEVVGTIKINGKKSRKLSRAERELFERYLFAMRAKDRIDNERATGNITAAVTEGMLDAIRQSLPDSRSFEDFEERGRIFQKIMDENLKFLLKTGRIGQAQYDGIKENNDFYATFNVIQSSDYDGAGRMDTDSISTEANVIRRIKGIAKDIANDYGIPKINQLLGQLTQGVITLEEFYNDSIIALEAALEINAISPDDYTTALTALGTAGFEVTSILGAAEEILYRSVMIGRKNEFMQQVAEIAKLDIAKKYSHIHTVAQGKKVEDYDTGEDKAVVFYEDGIKKVIVMDRIAAETLASATYPEISAALKFFRAFGKIMRYGVVTLNPQFVVANWIAFDMLKTLLFSKAGVLAGITTDRPLRNTAINLAMLIPDVISSMAEATSAKVFNERDLAKGMRNMLAAQGIKFDMDGYFASYQQYMESPAFAESVMGKEPLFGHEAREGGFGGKMQDTIAGKTLSSAWNLVQDVYGVPEMAGKLLGQKRLARINRQLIKDKSLKGQQLTAAQLSNLLKETAYELRTNVATPDFANAPTWLKKMSIAFPMLAARVMGIAIDSSRFLSSITLGKTTPDVVNNREAFQHLAQTSLFLSSLLVSAIAYYNNLFGEDDDELKRRHDLVAERITDDNIPIVLNKKVTIMVTYFDPVTGEELKTPVTTNEMILIPVRGIPGMAWASVNSMFKAMYYGDKDGFKKVLAKAIQEFSPINIGGGSASESGESITSSLNPIPKTYIEIYANKNTYTHQYYVHPNKLMKYDNVMKEVDRGLFPMEVAEEIGYAPWQIGSDYRVSQTERDISKWLYDNAGIKITANSINIASRNLGIDPVSVKRRYSDDWATKRFLFSQKSYPINREALFPEE